MFIKCEGNCDSGKAYYNICKKPPPEKCFSGGGWIYADFRLLAGVHQNAEHLFRTFGDFGTWAEYGSNAAVVQVLVVFRRYNASGECPRVRVS